MFFIFSCVCSKELTFKPHHYGSTSGAYTRSAHCNIMKTAWDFSLSMKLSMKMTHTIATALSHVKWSLEFEKKKVKWESHKSNGKTLITSCIDKRFALVLIRHQPRQYMHQGFRKHRGLARKCVQICSAISLISGILYKLANAFQPLSILYSILCVHQWQRILSHIFSSPLWIPTLNPQTWWENFRSGPKDTFPKACGVVYAETAVRQGEEKTASSHSDLA